MMSNDAYGEQIRQILRAQGNTDAQSNHAARTTRDVMDFRGQMGDPMAGQEVAYGHALGKFLQGRGHNEDQQ